MSREGLAAPERVIGVIKDYLRQRRMVDVRLDRLERNENGRHLIVEIGYASKTVWVNLRKGPDGQEPVSTESLVVYDESRMDEAFDWLDGRLN